MGLGLGHALFLDQVALCAVNKPQLGDLIQQLGILGAQHGQPLVVAGCDLYGLPELDRPAIVARLTAEMDKATAPVLKNLERSSLLIGLKPHVDTVTAHWGKVVLSNYRFPWNRAFEIDMDISVDPLTR